jgi:hypothetical protein
LFFSDEFLAKITLRANGTEKEVIEFSLVILGRLYAADESDVKRRVREGVEVVRVAELCCDDDAIVQEAAVELFVAQHRGGGVGGTETYMGLLQRLLHAAVETRSRAGFVCSVLPLLIICEC